MNRMQLVRYQGEFHEAVLALHRSAMEGIDTGMTPAAEEADLYSIEDEYFAKGGEFLVGLVDGEVAAIGGFRRISNQSAEIKRMRIRSDLQGNGYGTACSWSLNGERENRASPRFVWRQQ